MLLLEFAAQMCRIMDDEQLIQAVKEHQCLYNTKSADYKIQLRKENAWKAIALALGENISGKLYWLTVFVVVGVLV